MNCGFAGALLLSGAFALTSCQQSVRGELPIGSVDLPAPKAVVQGPVQVAGWALSEQPIQSVSVYLDRKYVGDASLKLARPDVAAARTGYKDGANSGWMATVDTSFLAPGWHELVAQARSRDGTTRDLATVPVLVKH